MNSLQSFSITGKSPYEMLFSKVISFKHFRIIGFKCYASIVPIVDKFSERAKFAGLMGYSATRKGYFMNHLITHNFFVTRDTVFQGNLFFFFTEEIT